MTPEDDAGFVARCVALCPGFVADPQRLRARKSALLCGRVDGLPVVAKAVAHPKGTGSPGSSLARPNAVWSWYLAREIAIYRAFAAAPPPFRVPRLVAASAELLVIERLPGAPLASRRRPAAALDEPTLRAFVALRAQLAAWRAPATPAPTPAVRAQLRERLLEDPTDPAWIPDGLARAGRRGLIAPERAAQLVTTLDPTLATCHGDLLLRNVLADGGGLALVDWECAGPYPRDWDLALLWTQLAPPARTRLAALVGAGPAFFALCAFALVRELRFEAAYGRTSDTLRAELAELA